MAILNLETYQLQQVGQNGVSRSGLHSNLDDFAPRVGVSWDMTGSGKWLLRVFAKDCLWDHEPLQQFVQDIRAVDPEATGKPFGTLEGLQSLRSGFQWAGLYALGAIFLVFLADFRRARPILWAFAPLAMGVLISLGVMGLCGVPLNPANIIAFPLILGVGAVYGVHVVHDYLGRRATRAYTLSHVIGRAILVMALLSNLFVLVIKPQRLGVYFVLLIGSLLLNLAVPMTSFLALPGLYRVVVSCLVVFVPVFFAGVIFAASFASSAQPDVDFGSNIGGAILGGLSENLSLVFGFNKLLIVAIVYYLLSAIWARRT